MPIYSNSVGLQGGVVSDLVEDRWLSNYAASVGDLNDRYFENRHGSPAVHPTYISQLEWGAIGELHEQLDMTDEERAQGVHSFNQTDLYASFASGDLLESSASLIGAEQRRSGVRLTYQIKTFVGTRKIARSFTQTVFRGVSITGKGVAPEMPDTGVDDSSEYTRADEIPFGKLAPYIFSECARDYGAIHTDRKAADAAGIPGLIMHGTGTFAIVLSAIVNHEAGGDPQRVAGFSGKLSAMVFCPSTAVLRTTRVDEGIRFELRNEADEPAISHGHVHLR